MTEYLCWGCMKPARAIKKHDPNSTKVFYLATCCWDESYAQMLMFNPQDEDNYK